MVDPTPCRGETERGVTEVVVVVVAAGETIDVVLPADTDDAAACSRLFWNLHTKSLNTGASKNQSRKTNRIWVRESMNYRPCSTNGLIDLWNGGEDIMWEFV